MKKSIAILLMFIMLFTGLAGGLCSGYLLKNKAVEANNSETVPESTSSPETTDEITAEPVTEEQNTEKEESPSLKKYPRYTPVGDGDISEEFIESLNNSPIDAYYEKKTDEQDSLTDIYDLYDEWTEAYEDEIEAIFDSIENAAKIAAEAAKDEYGDDDVVSSARDETIADLDKLEKSFEKFMDDYVSLTIDNYVVQNGYGTVVSFEASVAKLEGTKDFFFRIAEKFTDTSKAYEYIFNPSVDKAD